MNNINVESTVETMLQLKGNGDLRLSVVVDPTLPSGLLANTVAAISVGIGARHPELGNVQLTDADGASIYCSADRPVPILQGTEAVMKQLLSKALSKGDEITMIAFPAFARSLHSFCDYETAFPGRSLANEKIDGLGICGPTKTVKSLTGALKLLR